MGVLEVEPNMFGGVEVGPDALSAGKSAPASPAGTMRSRMTTSEGTV